MPEYVTEDRCIATSDQIIKQLNINNEEVKKLVSMKPMLEMTLEETIKLREKVIGNGNEEGSMLGDMKVTASKVDRLVEEANEQKKQEDATIYRKLEVTENKKDRNLALKVVTVSSIASVIIGLINILFG